VTSQHLCRFCLIVDQQRYRGRYDYGTRHPGLFVAWFEPLEPVTAGHMLFVPSLHVRTAREDPAVAGLAFEAAARYGGWHREEFILLANAGEQAEQSVFHLHVHYVPRREGDGLSFPWVKLPRDPNAPVPW